MMARLAGWGGGLSPTVTPTATGVPTSTPTGTPVPECILGDADNNGIVNVDDLKYTLFFYSSSSLENCADQNEDKKINTLDFASILGFLL
jgi:hypothetical protein